MTKYGTNKGAPLPASAFQSVQGYNAFNPNTNFHDPYNKANQNGVVFFPGSAPLYKDTTGTGLRSQLVGGLGVSGDGVFQDDDVTAVASLAYAPPRTVKRADMVKVRGRPPAVLQVQPQPARAAQRTEAPAPENQRPGTQAAIQVIRPHRKRE